MSLDIQFVSHTKKKSSPGSTEYLVKQVNDKLTADTFFQVTELIYKKDPNYIPFVREDIENIFDPHKNPYFKHGDATRWVLLNEKGQTIGRIAAFINFEKMYDENRKVGCVGFFECINDHEASNHLFDTAIQWLIENYQVEAVDGPVNFGENDKYWGLLIKGFEPASYGMNYNPSYYQELFEAYGFLLQYKQLTNYLNLKDPLPERFVNIAKRIINNKRYNFKPFRYKEREKFIKDFVEIYNLAWSSFKNFNPMDEDVIRKDLREMRPVMVEDFIWFAYADNKPVGFVLGLPDVNEIIKYSGPRFDWKGKLKFLFYKFFKGFTRIRVIVMGIVPDFQRHGLESALIYNGFNEGKKRKNYKHVELAWVGDFNDKMIAIHKAMGAIEYKQHGTFRKIL